MNKKNKKIKIYSKVCSKANKNHRNFNKTKTLRINRNQISKRNNKNKIIQNQNQNKTNRKVKTNTKNRIKNSSMINKMNKSKRNNKMKSKLIHVINAIIQTIIAKLVPRPGQKMNILIKHHFILSQGQVIQVIQKISFLLSKLHDVYFRNNYKNRDNL
jgi:hypothetical protein